MFEKTGLGVVLEFIGGDAAVAQMGNVQKGVAGMHSGFSRVGSGISQVGMLAVPAVVGLGAGIAGATWRAAEFEEGLLKIGTLLPGGAAEAQKYGSEIERMAIMTGQASKEVAEGMFQAISAGVSAGEAADFMGVANKAAISGFTGVATAVDGLTNLLNAYHLPVSKAIDLSDQMFIANQIGKTTFEELAGSIGNVAPTAALAGVKSDELLSAIAAMTLVGIDTATSVTSINNALLSFINPSKDAKATAKAYGIELNTAALRSKGFLKAITEIDQKIGGNEEALASIFGNIRSFRAAATLATGDGARVFESTLAQVRNSAGITERNFSDVSQGLKFKFGQAVQVIDAGAKRIGVAFIDAFGLSSLDPARFEERLGQIEASARKFFVGFKGAFTEVGSIFGGVGSSLDRIGLRLDTLASGSGAEVAGRMAGLITVFGAVTVTALPVVMAISAITSIVGGLVAVVSAAGPLLFTAISVLADAIGGSLLEAIQLVGIAAAWIVPIFAAIITDAQGLRTALGGLFDVLSQIASMVGQTVSPIFGGLWDVLMGVSNVLAAFLTPAVDFVTWALEGLLDPMEGARTVGQTVGNVFSWFGGVLTDLAWAITGLAVAVEDRLTTAWDTMTAHVKTAYEAVIGPMIRSIEWVLDKIGLIGGEQIDAGLGTSTGFWALDDSNRSRLVDRQDGWIYDREGTSQMDQLVLGVSEALAESRASDAEVVADAVKKTKITVQNHLNVDGRNMNAAVSQYQMELTERAGAKVTPWQRRAILERGVALRVA